MGRFINDDVKIRNGGRKSIKISIDELKNQLIKFFNKCEDIEFVAENFEDVYIYDILENESIVNDLKYFFYFEEYIDDEKERNMFHIKNDIGQPLLGFCTLDNGFTFFGIQGTADYGLPLFIILYYDGKKIRGYTPMYGNPINLDCRTMIGHEGERDNDIDIEKLIEKYKKNGYYQDSLEIDEIYLNKYGLTYDTTGFNWNAIKEDIQSRVIVS